MMTDPKERVDVAITVVAEVAMTAKVEVWRVAAVCVEVAIAVVTREVEEMVEEQTEAVK